MAAIDQHPADQHAADQHSTGHSVDPHSVDQHSVDPHDVDPHREPSADWGWHGGFPLAGPIAGWFTAIALFAMLIGNHESRVEDIWLVGLGLLLVVMLIGSHRNSRKSRRR